MKKLILLILTLSVCSPSYAEFIRCSGNLAFWFLDSKHGEVWQRRNANKDFYLHSQMMSNEIRFGGNWTTYDAELSIFSVLKMTKQNTKYKLSTDGRSWFTVVEGKKMLECDIAETEFF